MAILAVRHLTRYRYRQAVAFGEHRMMFRPCESWDQRLIEARLTIDPAPVHLRNMHDVFGNCVSIARFGGRARNLTFRSEVRLEHLPAPLTAEADDWFPLSPAVFPHPYAERDLPDLASSIEARHADPDGALENWARRFAPRGLRGRILDALGDMTGAVHEEFAYASRLTVGTQTPLETLRLRAGSCRDFAVLMIEAARRLGLAARFVSGYIYCPGAGAAGRARGGGHTHAWVRVYLPSFGWAEFDPTNGIVGGANLIRVAVARDPRQALPLHGTWMGEAGDYLGMDVEVDVEVEAEPRARRRVSLSLAP
ncbi:MAG TPA: transglutaminase family protein [Caulobacteraceae bacterium]|nr:transglutaminase family protein [Caulobacteraceae bacterium]